MPLTKPPGIENGLITSQIDTAPKRLQEAPAEGHGLITSQIDTAPKLKLLWSGSAAGLITSQIDTAPKRCSTIRTAAVLRTSKVTDFATFAASALALFHTPGSAMAAR